jgi:hypothetical protein
MATAALPKVSKRFRSKESQPDDARPSEANLRRVYRDKLCASAELREVQSAHSLLRRRRIAMPSAPKPMSNVNVDGSGITTTPPKV